MTAPFVDPRLRKNLDGWLVLALLGILAIGLVAIHFATAHNPVEHRNLFKQAAVFAVGLVLMAYVATRDYTRLARYAGPIYVVNIFLLLLLFAIGDHADAKGAGRWIPLGGGFKLQPSELAKLATIVTLAVYLQRLGPRIAEGKHLLKTLVFIGVPMGLIMKQPDLGTSLVVGAIWLAMTYLAGAKGWHLLAILGTGVALFGAAWHFDVGIHDYQKNRVLVLFDPGRDPRGLGYQINQSLNAIGGGQVTGQGIGKGMLTNGEWVPENHTDFIFTVIAEETGFVGAVAMLACFGLLLARALRTVVESEDFLGRMIACGVTAMLAFHVLVNIGMTCGIMPVVGVPLPFVSYGGSAALTNLVAVGLLLSASLHRRHLQF